MALMSLKAGLISGRR